MATKSVLDTDPNEALQAELNRASSLLKSGYKGILNQEKYPATNSGGYRQGEIEQFNKEYLADLRKRESAMNDAASGKVASTDPNSDLRARIDEFRAGLESGGSDPVALADVTNAPNASAPASGYTALPGYANILANIEQQTRGELPADVQNKIAQSAAERGVASGTGFRGADYLKALGLTSLGMTQQGQAGYAQMAGLGMQQQQLDLSKLSNAQQYELSQAKLALERGQLSIADYNAVTARIASQNGRGTGGGVVVNGGRTGSGQADSGSGVNLSDLLGRYKVGGNPMAGSGNTSGSVSVTSPAKGTTQDYADLDYLLGITDEPTNLGGQSSYFVDSSAKAYAPNDSGLPSSYDEYLFGSGVTPG